MAGLVSYNSSSGEEDNDVIEEQVKETFKQDDSSSLSQTKSVPGEEPNATTRHISTTTSQVSGPSNESQSRPTQTQQASLKNEQIKSRQDLSPARAVQGPSLGPSLPPQDDVNDQEESIAPASAPASVPSSPYTTARQLVHSLTLPTHPNLNIPASPPGSPRPSTTTKIQKFLDLKRQGVHFNAKLAASSALRNPSLFQKQLDFAGIDEEWGQYVNTLPRELGGIPPSSRSEDVEDEQRVNVLPNGKLLDTNRRPFPEWAYVEELGKSQAEILKQREAERIAGRRETVDFVPASATSSATTEKGHKGNKSGTASPSTSSGGRGSKDGGRHSIGSSRAGAHNDQAPRRSRFDERSPKRRKER